MSSPHRTTSDLIPINRICRHIEGICWKLRAREQPAIPLISATPKPTTATHRQQNHCPRSWFRPRTSSLLITKFLHQHLCMHLIKNIYFSSHTNIFILSLMSFELPDAKFLHQHLCMHLINKNTYFFYHIQMSLFYPGCLRNYLMRIKSNKNWLIWCSKNRLIKIVNVYMDDMLIKNSRTNYEV